MNVKEQLYTTLLEEVEKSPDLTKMYAKSNCRYCLGRGVIKQETGLCLSKLTYRSEDNNKFLPLTKNNNTIITKLCECVIKKIRKEVNEATVVG
jgi:hypothetical protein